MNNVSDARLLRSTIALTLGLCAMSQSHAQSFVATILRSGRSAALAIDGDNQYGASGGRSCSWRGTPQSHTPFDTGPEITLVNSVYGQFRGGHISPGVELFATMWNVSGSQRINLAADNMKSSFVMAMSADGQVGVAQFKGSTASRAVLWRGSATDYVDLTPEGVSSSSASGASDGIQVGTFRPLGNTPHPCLWRGTASSIVDLLPLNAHFGHGVGATEGIQVGSVDNTAALWRGTVQSYVNLSPPGATFSSADAADGIYQVGHAGFGGLQHAVIWSGTAESCIDLHKCLGPEYTSSRASDVSYRVTRLKGRPNTFRYRIDVVGSASRPRRGTKETLRDAVLWRLEGVVTRPKPEMPTQTIRINTGKLRRLKFVIDFKPRLAQPIPRWNPR